MEETDGVQQGDIAGGHGGSGGICGIPVKRRVRRCDLLYNMSLDGSRNEPRVHQTLSKQDTKDIRQPVIWWKVKHPTRISLGTRRSIQRVHLVYGTPSNVVTPILDYATRPGFNLLVSPPKTREDTSWLNPITTHRNRAREVAKEISWTATRSSPSLMTVSPTISPTDLLNTRTPEYGSPPSLCQQAGPTGIVSACWDQR